ncbi:MAG: PQQ-binding-like beta-propeller repeat protein [bacterium]|nr:PQQ-binding-like beta-propeller repeat protein [bacterium]
MKRCSFFIRERKGVAVFGALILCFLLVLVSKRILCPKTVAADVHFQDAATHAWPCQGHDSGHSGQSQFLGSQTDTLKWRWSAGGKVYSSPAVGADGTVYIGSDRGWVVALRVRDGCPIWSFETAGSVYSSPALGADGTVYIGSLDGRLYALRGQDGSLKWSYRSGDEIYGSPAIGADGTVYIGSLDGRLYALRGQDGSLKWSYRTGYWIYGSPAVGADGTVYIGGLDGRLYALRGQDGSLKWSYRAGDEIYGSPAIGADGTVYIGSLDGQLYALRGQDGSLKWSYRAGGGISSSPAIGADGTVYIGSLDGYLYAFGSPAGLGADSIWPCWRLNAQHTGQSLLVGPKTPTLKWKCQIGGEVYSSPIVALDGTIYIGSYDSKIYALKPDGSGVKWSYQAGGQVRSTPAIASDGTIYAAAFDGLVYALKSLNGSLKWSYQTGNQIYSSPSVGPDGTVYIAGLDGKVYALKPDGSLKWSYKADSGIYSSPALSQEGLVYVASGDGKLYALNSQDGRLVWSYQTRERIYSSPALDAYGTLYIGGLNGRLYALSSADGSLRWKYQTGGALYSSPAVGSNGSVYIGSLDGRIYALNAQDGGLVWSYQTGGGIYSSAALAADGIIYIGSLDGRIYALNAQDGGLVWSYKAASRIDSSPAIADGGIVYVADLSGTVYAFADPALDKSPQLSCPGPIVVLATGPKTKVYFPEAIAIDDQDPKPQITYDHVSGSEFPVGTTIVKVTARDNSGNVSLCSFPVTVKDIEPPRILCPSDIVVSATGPKTRVNFVATASDNTDQSPQIVSDYQPDSEFPLGVTKVKVMAKDASGNSSTCYFTVTVKDTTPPLIICPSDMIVSAAGPKTRVNYSATASDDIDPKPQILYDPAPGSEFPLGTTQVTATAKDSSGNSTTCSFKVTVRDSTAPIIRCPQSLVIPAEGRMTRVSYTVTATDNVDQEVKVICEPASGSEFTLGTHTVRASAIDSAGNSTDCTFEVLVKDIEPPIIRCPATVEATASGSLTKVNFTATAEDKVDPSPRLIYDHVPGSEFPVGITTVKVTAIDSAGNSSISYITVNVKDPGAPTLICPADMIVSATGAKTRVDFSAQATDATDPNPTVIYNPAPGSEFPLGTTWVTVVAKDSSGNSSTCSFKVTVRDSEPPRIICPADMIVSATGAKTRVDFSAQATDAADPRPQIVYDPAPGSEFPLGTTRVTVVATDASGNRATCTFNVVVQDTDLPLVALTLGEKPPYDTSQGMRIFYTASDICDPAPKVKVELSNNGDPAVDITASSPILLSLQELAGKNTVTVTATDACGNVRKETVSFEVTLKLIGDQIVVKPETLRIYPGIFTVSLAFPPPYDVSTIREVEADGARYKKITYQSENKKTICEFNRSDIKTLPLDNQFEIRGSFVYKGTECTFFGTDTIQWVRQIPTQQNGWLSGGGRRPVFDGTICHGLLCDEW